VFRVNKKDAAGSDGMTQFERALHALNIDIICANSSQAKGRVERTNRTLQDRLVKEMRLRNIDTPGGWQCVLADIHGRLQHSFAKAPFDERDCIVTSTMTTSMTPLPGRKNPSPKSDAIRQGAFILVPNEITRSLACKRVMILDYPDGRFAIRHNGVDLPYRTSTSGRRSIRLPSLRINAWSSTGLLPRNRRSWTCRWPRHAARTTQSHVQGRIARSKALQPRNPGRSYPSPQTVTF
jgi:hypothetical protein